MFKLLRPSLQVQVESESWICNALLVASPALGRSFGLPGRSFGLPAFHGTAQWPGTAPGPGPGSTPDIRIECSRLFIMIPQPEAVTVTVSRCSLSEFRGRRGHHLYTLRCIFVDQVTSRDNKHSAMIMIVPVCSVPEAWESSWCASPLTSCPRAGSCDGTLVGLALAQARASGPASRLWLWPALPERSV